MAAEEAVAEETASAAVASVVAAHEAWEADKVAVAGARASEATEGAAPAKVAVVAVAGTAVGGVEVVVEDMAEAERGPKSVGLAWGVAASVVVAATC